MKPGLWLTRVLLAAIVSGVTWVVWRVRVMVGVEEE
jgi:hypothetical protein